MENGTISGRIVRPMDRENVLSLHSSSRAAHCVICVNARATMQTAPCGHRVVCRRCFVKTIQMAVSQRLLPLRCVICRAKILRLKQTLIPRDYSMSGKSWVLPQSASEYNMSTGVPIGVPGPGGRWTSGNVPASASLYSMASGSSSISGVSSVSSATSSSVSSAGSSGSSSLGKPSRVRQPIGASFRKTQTQSMKMRIQEYQDPIQPAPEEEDEALRGRLPPIKEFQRDYKLGKTSTRLRCAQKIVTQLETAPPTNRPTTANSSSSSSGSSTGPSTSKSSSSISGVSSTSSSSSSSSSKAATKQRGTSSTRTTSPHLLKSNAKPLTVAQEVQRAKKEKEREKEREKAEKARLKEEEKAEKARQKELKKLAKEEKKRAKKEAKAHRKEAEEALLRDSK